MEPSDLLPPELPLAVEGLALYEDPVEGLALPEDPVARQVLVDCWADDMIKPTLGAIPRGLGRGQLGPADLTGRWRLDSGLVAGGVGPFGPRLFVLSGVASAELAAFGLSATVSAVLRAPEADAALLAEFGPAQSNTELCTPLSASVGLPGQVDAGKRFSLVLDLLRFEGDLALHDPDALTLPVAPRCGTIGQAVKKAADLEWLSGSGNQRRASVELCCHAARRWQWRTFCFPDVVLRPCVEASLAETLLEHRMVVGCSLSSHLGRSVDGNRAQVEILHLGAILALCREAHARRFGHDRPADVLALALPSKWEDRKPADRCCDARAWRFRFSAADGVLVWRSSSLSVRAALDAAYDHLCRD